MRAAFPYPERDPYFCLRQCLIDICDGDHCAASILDVLIYWDGIRKGQIEQELARSSADREYSPNLDRWIYKSYAHLSEDMRGHYGEKSIRAGVKIILSKQFASVRSNPSNSLDRTPQYCVDTERIKAAIASGSKGRTGQLPPETAKMPDAPGENAYETAKMPDAPGENAASYKEAEVTSSEITQNTPFPPLEEKNSNPTQNPEVDTDGDPAVFVKNAYSRLNRRAKLDRLNTRAAATIVEDIHRAEGEWGAAVFRSAVERYLLADDDWLREHRWPIRGLLKNLPRWVEGSENSYQRASRGRADCVNTTSEAAHPQVASPEPASGSAARFASRWNELVPSRPIDPALCTEYQAAYGDQIFSEKFDEICRKAADLIEQGSTLTYLDLLKWPKGAPVPWWKDLLAGGLRWTLPKKTRAERQNDAYDRVLARYESKTSGENCGD